MSGPLCGLAVVAFDAVRCGAADLPFSVRRSVISLGGALRCSVFWPYESLAHRLVAAQLCEWRPQKIRWLPRTGGVTIMKLLLLADCSQPRRAALGQ